MDKHHNIDDDDDVDPEGGGHGDAAGDVAHSPLLGELQVAPIYPMNPYTSTRERLFRIFESNFGSAFAQNILTFQL